VKRVYEKSKAGGAPVISPKSTANSKTQLRSETLPVGAIKSRKPLAPQ
jgi:hypothetical protein